MPSRLTLHCLGPLEIRLGDATLEGFDTRKARALLVYLACRAGREFSREHLQALLWGESPPVRAARSLRQALVNLKRILPEDCLRITRETISFNSECDCEVDAARFEADPPEPALYRGTFLEGFDLHDAPLWEEWLSTKREELRVCALEASEALGARHAARGEYRPAIEHYRRALAIDSWRETAHRSLMRLYALSGDRRGMAAALNNLGMAAFGLGEYGEAKQRYQESLDIDREMGNQFGVALSLTNLGVVAEALGHYAEARQLYGESLAIRRTIGDQWGAALCLNNLGVVAETLGDYTAAQRYYQESLAIFREIGDQRGIALPLKNLGDVAYQKGEYAEARQRYQESLVIRQEIGDRRGIVFCLTDLGNVTCALGEYPESRHYFQEALRAAVEIQATPSLLEILVGLAALLAKRGANERAVELLAVAIHHAATEKKTRDRAERLRAELAARLPPKAVVTAVGRGKTRRLEEVAAEILGESGQPVAQC